MSMDNFKGTELTDEELMEMTGGASFASASNILVPPIMVVCYGILPFYGIPPITKESLC
ncbi:hypothetical protein DFR58_11856 [Anaerobacterium chartisolvens]|uniref:Uncharacterized protein n=1 Tax=Anaerobacterium chartisolvens TaxID=1297424 RepID=A0A369AY39_9FIRM|nr:hypothetical protein [Anaerobacterium chartisolvens]RCX13238.1 hypothetical protein DFR58_11856 [Anaerobacterium chartisolvens]